jgi:hypothetical protein
VAAIQPCPPHLVLDGRPGDTTKLVSLRLKPPSLPAPPLATRIYAPRKCPRPSRRERPSSSRRLSVAASQLVPHERRPAVICMLRMVATDPQASDWSLSSRERLVTAPSTGAIKSTFSLVRRPLHSGAAWGCLQGCRVFTLARRSHIIGGRRLISPFVVCLGVDDTGRCRQRGWVD